MIVLYSGVVLLVALLITTYILVRTTKRYPVELPPPSPTAESANESIRTTVREVAARRSDLQQELDEMVAFRGGMNYGEPHERHRPASR